MQHFIDPPAALILQAKVRAILKRPRAYGDNVYENLLIEDQDRAKRKHEESMDWESQPSIILGLPKIKRIRVASLCPPLKCRFIHPGGE